GRFNSASYQGFLQMILAQTTQHLFLIHDGARYHTSASTPAFLAAQSERITAEPLPSYSPDDNPIEYLWKKALIMASATLHPFSLSSCSSRRTEGRRRYLYGCQDRSKHRPRLLPEEPFCRRRSV